MSEPTINFFAKADAFFLGWASNGTSQILQALSGNIAPVFTLVATIYVAWEGMLILTGKSQGALGELVMKTLKLAVICTVVLSASVYNDWVVQPVTKGIPEFVSGLMSSKPVSATGPGNIFDKTINGVIGVGERFWNNSGWSPGEAVKAAVTVFIVDVSGILFVLEAFFFLMLARLYSWLVVLVGPIFVCCAMFESTRGYFKSWVNLCVQWIVFQLIVSAILSLAFTSMEKVVGAATAVGFAVSIWNLVMMCIFLSFLMPLALPMSQTLASGMNATASMFGQVGAARMGSSEAERRALRANSGGGSGGGGGGGGSPSPGGRPLAGSGGGGGLAAAKHWLPANGAIGPAGAATGQASWVPAAARVVGSAVGRGAERGNVLPMTGAAKASGSGGSGVAGSAAAAASSGSAISAVSAGGAAHGGVSGSSRGVASLAAAPEPVVSAASSSRTGAAQGLGIATTSMAATAVDRGGTASSAAAAAQSLPATTSEPVPDWASALDDETT